MNGSQDLYRTDGRTDGRTDRRELIGPNRSAGDQKWKKYRKVKAVGPERTFGRTHKREWIYRFRSLSWETKNKISTVKFLREQILAKSNNF